MRLNYNAIPLVAWLFLRKCCPSFNLGDLLNPLKSLVREQSAVFAFYAGAQKCTRWPNLKAALYVLLRTFMFYITQHQCIGFLERCNNFLRLRGTMICIPTHEDSIHEATDRIPLQLTILKIKTRTNIILYWINGDFNCFVLLNFLVIMLIILKQLKWSSVLA